MASPPAIRLLSDPADLVCLAVISNPYMAASTIVDRQVVSEQIGLLVGGAAEPLTCLYLWVAPVEDLSPWMAHAVRWLRRYPQWRRVHGLVADGTPPRLVLAGPEFGEAVRPSLGFLNAKADLVRYTCVEFQQVRSLCWEETALQSAITGEVAADSKSLGHRREHASILSPEEIAFFQRV